MSVVEQTPSRGSSRFGKLSSNMFFIRNTAKPKRVRHIEGLNGALICNVNDDPSLVRSSSTSVLNFNNTNLPAFETPRRVERIVPPMGFWNTYGVVHDTERWKKELAALATASGLGIEKDEQKHSNKTPQTAVDQQHASRSGAHYSRRTGRFNEGPGKSRGRTGSKRGTATGDILFNVPENEREMWMLQVLCQLLNTSNLEDVQSWLVSASQTEKDQARTMIHSALRGLRENEQSSDQKQDAVDLNALTNFVEKQKYDEKTASQKYINNTLNRHASNLQSIDEEQQTDISLNDTIDSTKNHSTISQQNLTTYKRAFPPQQRSYTSFDGVTTNKQFEQNHQDKHDEEQIDTIQLDDDRRRPQSATVSKSKKISTVPETFLPRPPSSHKQKHRVESMQFTDDGGEQILENTDNNQQKEASFLSVNSTKSPSTREENGNNKSRKIRQLQRKLSEQEEETKKKFDELQSKQSRLENAVKLLMKQTATYKKRQKPSSTQVEDVDAPVVNVIIQSPRENAHSQDRSNRKRNSTEIKSNKISDYTVEDVKVQISLSRLDNHHSTRTYSGVWKPDASTFQRLHGN